MTRRNLPIGIHTFRELREEGCYYVDKTAFMHRLVSEARHCVLSRPRRFGKSVFLDTLGELFEGSEALFAGLHIHEHWDWSMRHPVVRLDFGAGHFTEPGRLEAIVTEQLAAVEVRMGQRSEYRATPQRFASLLEALHTQTGQPVVVLIDEYDKPILDAMNEPEVARANRSYLRGLYAFIKSSDAHVRFTFLTGVSKFSRHSLFFGLDDLQDITLDPRCSAICGYTDEDLDTVFAPELPGLDRETIRDWYHGYNWLGDAAVYNPFDVLLLFRNRTFNAWWFETGTPPRLAETLLRRGITSVSLARMPGNLHLLSAFDVDHVGTEALLFQSGYVTITAERGVGGEALYRLGYPNRAVRQRLNEQFLHCLMDRSPRQMAIHVRLYRLLEAADLAGLRNLFRAFFASIPKADEPDTDVTVHEGYYAGVFYSCFAALGLSVTVEDSTTPGRLDIALSFSGNVYLFEFKVVELASEAPAMARLQGRGYVEKYRREDNPVYLVAVEFSRETRRVVSFEAVPADAQDPPPRQ